MTRGTVAFLMAIAMIADQSDVHADKQREDQGLDESNEDFEEVERGLRVVQIIEAAHQSMRRKVRRNGETVKIQRMEKAE